MISVHCELRVVNQALVVLGGPTEIKVIYQKRPIGKLVGILVN